MVSSATLNKRDASYHMIRRGNQSVDIMYCLVLPGEIFMAAMQTACDIKASGSRDKHKNQLEIR